MISIIAALSANRVIGRDGGLPWHLPDDFKHFRRTTLGKPVLMGRRTWESLDGPLPKRDNIVVTRSRNYTAEGARVAPGFEQALALVRGAEEVVVIGGASLYRSALPRAERMYLTHIEAEIEGDTRFPDYPEAEWREVSRESHSSDEKHAFAFSIVTYERRSDPER